HTPPVAVAIISSRRRGKVARSSHPAHVDRYFILGIFAYPPKKVYFKITPMRGGQNWILPSLVRV
ncbi:MAG: hypothetical protein ACK2U1_12800, partial [Anaerolineales bacterium]